MSAVGGGAVGNREVGGGAVGDREVGGGAVGDMEVGGSAVGSAEVGGCEVESGEFDGAVGSGEVDDAVGSGKVGDGQVSGMECPARDSTYGRTIRSSLGQGSAAVSDARRGVLLIVSGHDPSGAGIDADLAAVEALDLEVRPVVTARTDQDAIGVRSIGARDPDAWSAEARAAARGGVAAVKFGLLPGRDHLRAARDLVREIRRSAGREVAVVVDPVIRASSGGVFLEKDAVEVLRGELVAEGVVLTPNLAEAAELACLPARRLASSLAARVEGSRILLALGAVAVVIKGGHGEEDPVRDLVAVAEGEPKWIEHARIRGRGMRGSGCRFATRVAAGLASGVTLARAAADAGEFVAGEIARGGGVAGGSGR